MNNDSNNCHSIQDRRSFLKAGTVACLGTAFAGLSTAGSAEEHGTGEARTQFKVKPIDSVRVGFVGVGGMGMNHLGNYLNIDGVQVKAICDIVPAKVERAQQMVVKAGQPKPTGYSNGSDGFPADVRNGRTRSGNDRHALGVARAGLRRRHEKRQTCRNRGPGGHEHRRLLEARRDGREVRKTLPDDGKLLLRPHRADDAEHGPQGLVGRNPSCRGRLPARPARRQVRQPRRGALAPGMVGKVQRQPLPDARFGPRRTMHEHQPRRRLRLSRFDEQSLARNARIRSRAFWPRFAAKPRSNLPSAM